MRLSLMTKGLLSSREVNSWSESTRRRIWNDVRGGMDEGGRVMAARARAQAASVFKGRKAAASIKHKVYSRNRERMPVLQIYSKIPWLNLHETGRIIGGKMLVPFGEKRMRRSSFKALVDRLFREKRAFFVRSGRSTVLMAKRGENSTRGDGVGRFSGHYGRYLKAKGKDRAVRGAAVPIGVIVNRVTVKRRLRIEETIKRNLPAITRSIRGQ